MHFRDFEIRYETPCIINSIVQAILLISVLFSFKFFLNREPGMCEKLTKMNNLNKGISVEDHIP